MLGLFRFKDEDDAMDYAIANQRDRRNLTNAELTGLVMVVDKRKATGGNYGNQHTGRKPAAITPLGVIANSSHVTAELAGTSPRKVERIRTILDYAEQTGDTSEKDAVLRGDVSINKAEKMVRRKKNQTKKRLGAHCQSGNLSPKASMRSKAATILSRRSSGI
jgi:hypothetical protein